MDKWPVFQNHRVRTTKNKKQKTTRVTDTQADRPSRVASQTHVHGFGVWEEAGVAGEAPPTQTQGVCVDKSGWKQLIKTKKNTSVQGRTASFVLMVTRYLFIHFFFFFKNNAAVANWFGIFKIRSALNFARRCALNENAACCQRATQRFTLIDSLMSGESLL